MIELKNITKTYKTGPVEYNALKNISFKIDKGEFVAIMGASGSGKSTTMHILGCLDTPTKGEYLLNGKNVGKLTDEELSEIRNQEIGFVFQAFNLLPRYTVLENVLLPFIYSKVPSKERKRRALEAIEKVGLSERMNNRSNQLSGGQIQRTAIARSLVMNPSIILADEPTGNLDSKTSHEIMDVFKKLNEQGNTVIVITHE
ncbi:MAG: ABC transporter ATP-binding protein, partial [bacterium]